MAIPLRVLIVEDSEMDCSLIVRVLSKSGYSPIYERVDSAETMNQALDSSIWDIILCDYVLPGFGGLEAIKLLQRKGLDIPLIIVSGNVGEDIAVDAMKAGAQDYVMKGNWKRLIPAIQRELVEADIRRQKQRAEENLKEMNRAREVLIRANESIMRATSEETLLNTVCRMVVESGGYRMCWIGYAKRDEQKTVMPVAQAGYEEGYLEGAGITWADTVRGRGPTGASIRTGNLVISRNIETDATFSPWREEAVKRGYASSISLPLISKEEVFGAVNIYAAETERFDTDEVQLLSSLASDLSFGIIALRTRLECDLAEAELRNMANRIVRTQEEERRGIAIELHDQIGQSLTGLKLMMNQAARTCPSGKCMEVLKESELVIAEVIQQVREMSLKLRPSMLDDLGLLPTLLWHFERYSKQTQITVNFNHQGLEGKHNPDISTTVYRVVQEALNNVARYAKVTEVDVSIQAQENTINLKIEDRGCGFDIASASAKGSSGLSGMRERAQSVGGILTIEARPGVGTKITAELPSLWDVRGKNN
jgi:signal transduction histidine kinase